MKNRRNIIIAFLLCASLIVGVGYAAVADVLDVDGTAELGLAAERDFDTNIEFTAAEVFSAGDTASITQTNKDKVTFSVSSVKDSQTKAFFKFTFVNNNDSEIEVYLSNYLTGETITNNAGEATATAAGNRLYNVTYSLCTVSHDSEADITANGHALHEPESEGPHSFEAGAQNNVTVPEESTAYLYVEVSLNPDFDYDGDSGENDALPDNCTVSATFGLEFSVWSESATVNA